MTFRYLTLEEMKAKYPDPCGISNVVDLKQLDLGTARFRVREINMRDVQVAVCQTSAAWICTDNDMRIFLTLMQKGYIREIGWMKFYFCPPYPWAER
jgi:hypothetical protein